MSFLRDDRFNRGGFPAPRTDAFSLRLPVLFFVSFALMALSRLDHPAVRELRAEAQAVIAPALGAMMVPLDPARRLARQVQSSYDSFSELERLQGENQRLKQWESRAHDLERRIGELATLTKTLEQHKIDYRTVRVIATANGAFLQSALLEAGTEHGIRVGFPVLSAQGVLGRIVEAGRRTSRVLLLTDVNSRVPVVIGSAQIRAIAAGDNGPEPRLMHLPAGASVDAGEEISTTGLGGMFPRGLRIGVTAASPTGPRIVLDANLGDIEYVSVLLYDNPGVALTTEVRPSQPEMPARGRGSPERSVRP